MITHQFSGDQHKQLRDVATELGVTMNDLLICKLFQAVAAWNGSMRPNQKIRIMVPSDMRDGEDFEMPACNCGSAPSAGMFVRDPWDARAVGLETAAEQLAAFDGMSPEVQLALLDAMIKDAPGMPKQLEALTTAYLAGDLERLETVARGQYADMPPAVREWFDRVLLAARNERMLARLAALIDEGPVFAAVGALHLGGEDV